MFSAAKVEGEALPARALAQGQHGALAAVVAGSLGPITSAESQHPGLGIAVTDDR
jgi:hypothetical protein